MFLFVYFFLLKEETFMFGSNFLQTFTEVPFSQSVILPHIQIRNIIELIPSDRN